MPVQLTLRSPKGGRVLAERDYPAGRRVDAVGGWLAVVDGRGSVVALHAACPGLEAAVVECTATTASAAEEDDGAPEPPPLRVADVRVPGHPIDDELIDTLHALGRTYGPLGVALAASTLTDPDVLAARLTAEEGEVRPEPQPSPSETDLVESYERQADALRSEVARLQAGWDDTERARQLVVERAARAEHTEQTWRREVDEQTARAESEHAARLRAERLLAQQQETTEHLRGLVDGERARAERAEGLTDAVELYVPAAARVTWDGRTLRALYLRPHDGTVGSEVYTDGKGRPLTIEDVRDGDAWQHDEPRPRETVRPPIAEDPRRPSLDSWPDDAVLLTYRELRRLVSLHLERCSDSPELARAMLEGESPLRVSEVLDR